MTAKRGIPVGWLAAAAGALLLFAGCAAQRKLEFPVSPDITPGNRALMIERYDKGKILFRANCSGCHGIFAAGKDSVPNFSKEQIDNYNANFVKGDQRNHAVARKLSQQQIDYILTFLGLHSAAHNTPRKPAL